MRRKREEDKTRLGKESEKRVGEGCGRVQEEEGTRGAGGGERKDVN